MLIKLFNWFTKITGWLPQKFIFRTKIYYEDKKLQGRNIKGPAIIISNHTHLVDYVIFLFVFFGRTLRYQMAEVLFQKPALGVILKMMGGIFVDRNTFDFSFVGKSQKILEKGGVVGIFPESRLPLPDEKRPLPFKSSAAYLAYLTGVKVIPIVTNGSYFKKKRARVLIGKPLDVRGMWDSSKSQRENLQEVSEKLRREIARLTKELERRQKLDELRPPFYYLRYDFAKVTAALPALVWYRPKTVYFSDKAKKHHKKNVLFYSNHTGFKDPLYIMLGIWYRRIHFVVLQEIMDNPKMKYWFGKVFRTIPVDRENMSFATFRKVASYLEAGCAACIFPEGHIKTGTEKVDDFKNGMILMAIKGKSPLVPVFVVKRPHWYNRQVMFQGEAIDLIEMYGSTPSMQQIEEAGKLCRDRELELAEFAENYYKSKK